MINQSTLKMFQDIESRGTKESEEKLAAINIAAERNAFKQAEENRKAAEAKTQAAANVLAQQQAQYKAGKSAIEAATTKAVTGVEKATTAAQEGLYPWRDAGTDALGQLMEKITAGPGDYTQSPGYEARLAEGQRSIERSAAARGNVLSGAAVKAATRYGQDYATQDYDNFLSRYYESLAPLQGISSQGYGAAQQIGAYGMQGAGQVGNYLTGGAQQVAGLGERSTAAQGQTQLYSGEATAEGKINTSNVLAAQQAAATERDYAYQAWKAGKDF